MWTKKRGLDPGFLLPPYDGIFPGLGFDSWYSIGLESAPSGSETAISAVESITEPWIGTFDATSALSGQDFAMTDITGGSWYILNGSPNGLPDAENQRVLILQVTTTGSPAGVINAQVFPNGNGSSDERLGFVFDGPGVYPALVPETISDICGCTDPTASNYNEGAIYDNESCVYYIEGCTDPSACNFEAVANLDDGSCEYAEFGYDCDGNCLIDTDGDGICQQDEVVGCQENTAIAQASTIALNTTL